MVSRSEVEDLSSDRSSSKKARRSWADLHRHDNTGDSSEIDLHISVSYKTLVFAFVTFDIIRSVINTIVGVF